MGLKQNERKYVEKETDPFKADYNWDCKFGVFLAILGALCFGCCVGVSAQNKAKESSIKAPQKNPIVQPNQQIKIQSFQNSL